MILSTGPQVTLPEDAVIEGKLNVPTRPFGDITSEQAPEQADNSWPAVKAMFEAWLKINVPPPFGLLTSEQAAAWPSAKEVFEAWLNSGTTQEQRYQDVYNAFYHDYIEKGYSPEDARKAAVSSTIEYIKADFLMLEIVYLNFWFLVLRINFSHCLKKIHSFDPCPKKYYRYFQRGNRLQTNR